MRVDGGRRELMTIQPDVAGPASPEDPAFFALLRGSFARLVGTPLIPADKDAAWLYYEAPFAVVAHNTDADPRFIYANKTAQACFGAITGLPSLPSLMSLSLAFIGSVMPPAKTPRAI